MTDPYVTLRAKAILEQRRRKHNKKLAAVQGGKPLTLRQFALSSWHVLETRQFTPGWHIEAQFDLLEAVSRRDLQYVVMNVPPGSMKSLTANVFFPAWEWAEVDASRMYLMGTHAARLGIRDSVRMRKLVSSNWYQQRYGKRVRISKDQNTKARWETTAGGMRIAASVGASSIGERVHTVLIDDPQAASQIHTVKRTAANNWLQSELITRAISPEEFATVIIMQRLHQNDMSGYALAEMTGFEHFFIPARYEPGRSCSIHVRGFSFEDPRTEAGEIFWPEKYSKESLDKLERNMGGNVQGQMQQRPTKPGGEMMEQAYWNFYQPDDIEELPPVELVNRDNEPIQKHAVVVRVQDIQNRFQSWDMTFKDTKASDYVVGGCFGNIQGQAANLYLLGIERAQADFPATIKMFQAMTNRYPTSGSKYIEDKANGSAIISTLKNKIPGIREVNPRGSKVERVQSIMWMLKAGNLYLPHPQWQPWVNAFIDEWDAFPKGANDDQVDMTSQALIEYTLTDRGELTEALDASIMDGLLR